MLKFLGLDLALTTPLHGVVVTKLGETLMLSWWRGRVWSWWIDCWKVEWTQNLSGHEKISNQLAADTWKQPQ